jgi:carbamoyltransferase
MTHDTKWEKLFGIKRRKEQDTLLQSHINMAMAIQKVTEECMLLMAKEAIRITGIENLCLAGGVALNCVSNQGILEAGICKDIYIQPAAGDAGCSVGAALAAHHLFFNEKRINTNADGMNGAYLGPSYRKQEIENVVNQHSANGRWIENTTELINIIANKLAEGKTVGWFRGRMEFGPRALGNRSILADARLEGMQQRINTSVKFRESFRPFAPIVREEKASEYFSLQKPSPYMLFTAKVIDDDRNLPFENTPKKWRFPATTHVDGTARVQTVNRDTNKHLWHLLHCFEDLTSSGVLLNTSFNIRGEPIVNTPLQAYECFMQTDMDLLVLENMLFDKQLQPLANKDHIWRREFEKD